MDTDSPEGTASTLPTPIPPEAAQPEPAGAGVGAVRSWLMRGTRKGAIDPRRKAGRHAQTRRLLSMEPTNAPTGKDAAWQGTVSALQRHTIDAGLAQLKQHDRRLLTLAFLEGHSNPELAAMLGVSARTVSRRLTRALATLEQYVSHVAMWIAAVLLFVLATVGAHSVRLLRLTGALKSVGAPSAAVSVAAAGVAAAVVFGVVVVSPNLPSVIHASTKPPAAASGLGAAARHDLVGPSGHPLVLSVGGATAPKDQDLTAGGGPATGDGNQSKCGGKPTNAPPVTPVGPRSGQTGPPVTHPGPGRCGKGKG